MNECFMKTIVNIYSIFSHYKYTNCIHSHIANVSSSYVYSLKQMLRHVWSIQFISNLPIVIPSANTWKKNLINTISMNVFTVFSLTKYKAIKFMYLYMSYTELLVPEITEIFTDPCSSFAILSASSMSNIPNPWCWNFVGSRALTGTTLP